jgi:hypothetical protein
MPEYTGETVAQFGTLCGATVDLIRLDHPPTADRFDHAWQCRGCGQTCDTPDVVRDSRKKANAHASSCRSLPQPETT